MTKRVQQVRTREQVVTDLDQTLVSLKLKLYLCFSPSRPHIYTSTVDHRLKVTPMGNNTLVITQTKREGFATA